MIRGIITTDRGSTRRGVPASVRTGPTTLFPSLPSARNQRRLEKRAERKRVTQSLPDGMHQITAAYVENDA